MKLNKKKPPNKTKQEPQVNRIRQANKLKKKRRTSPLDVLLNDTLEKVTEGNITVQRTPFEISYNKILTTKHVKQVIQILEFPFEGIDIGYVERIKDMIKFKIPTQEKQLFDIIQVQHASLNRQVMGSKKIRTAETRTAKILASEEEALEILKNPVKGFSGNIEEAMQYDKKLASSIRARAGSRDDIYRQEKLIKILRKKLESFKVVDKYQRDGGTCVDLYIFLEVITPTVDLTAFAVKELKQILLSEGFTFREITDLENYQKSFSLASIKPPTKKSLFDAVPFITTSNLVNANSEKSGIVRASNPDIYIGNNIDNNYRVDISLSNSSFNENYLMISKTSKTLSLMVSILFWLNQNNHYLIVKEYKGKEWTPFFKLFDKSSIITMDIDNPTFVNTLSIVDYKKYGFSNPVTSYSLSYSITVNLLISLINPKNPSETEKAICAKIVTQCYLNIGVDINSPITYSNSQTINFSDTMWSAIDKVSTDNDLARIYSLSEIHRIKNTLSKYFSPSGSRAFLFKRALNLDTIIFNNRLLLFDYNSNGVSDNGQLENESFCRMFQEHYVETLFCAIRKMRNEHTLVIQESLDELLDNPFLMEEISKSYNNPNNTINIATLRSTATLFNNKSMHIKRLLQLVSGYIIGNCDTTIMEELKANTNLINLPETLNNLSSMNNKYKYAFLWYSLNNNYEPVVVKHIIPKDYATTLQPVKI